MVLFEGDFLINIGLVLAGLILLVHLFLKVGSNLFVFVDGLNLSLLFELARIRILLARGGGYRRVLSLKVGVVCILLDYLGRPEIDLLRGSWWLATLKLYLLFTLMLQPLSLFPQ